MVTGDQVLREGLRWSGGLFSPDSGVLVVGLLVDVLRFLVDPRTGLLPMVDVGVAANGQCKLQNTNEGKPTPGILQHKDLTVLR